VDNDLTQSTRGNWQTRIGSSWFPNSVPCCLTNLDVAVVDASTGEPIPDASITIGSGYWGCHDGPAAVRFRLEDGTHALVAKAQVYKPTTNSVTVLDGTNAITLDPGSGTQTSVLLSWPSQPGESYTVESSEGIGQAFVTVQKDIVSTPPLTRFTYRIPDAGSGQLLRVRRQ